MRPSHSLAWIVAGAAAVFACSQNTEKSDAWNCTMAPVPGGGEAVNCVSKDSTGLAASSYVCTEGQGGLECPPLHPYLVSAVAVFYGGGTSDGLGGTTSDGPPPGGTTDGTGGTTGTSGGTTTTSGGTTDGTGGTTGTSGGTTTTSGGTTGTSGGTTGTSGGTTSSGGTSDGPGTTGGGGICDYCPDCIGCGGTSDGGGGSSGGTTGSSGGSSGTTSSGGTTGSSGSSGTSGTSGTSGSHGNGNGGGNASSSGGSSGNASSSGGTTGDGSGGASSSGASGNNGNGGGNGNGSSGGYTGHGPGGGGGGASSSGASGNNGGGNGGNDGSGGGYQCEVDDGGYRNCHKIPVCLPGTHASPCGACVPDASGSEDCTPPTQGGCWVTGGGFIVDNDGKDSFGGNAMPMKSGTIRGEWEHQDHGTQSKAHGQATYIVCRHVDGPGPGQPGGKKGFDINQVYFGGPARYFTNGAWADGYWFDVVAEDHGEPGNTSAHKGTADHYHFTLRQVQGANQSGTVVYETKGDLVGGNIQIHPANAGHPYTPSQLPAWVSLEP